MRMKGKIIAAFACVIAIWGIAGTQNVKAEIASDQAFENAAWEMVHEESLQGTGGVAQSMCCTKDYIVCIENVSDAPQDLDVVYYFYKNDVDENGNPVEQYSLAKTISNMSYEHGNGMAYNPKTDEIVISLYTNNEGDENRGALYVMDASTFDLKRKVQISTDYNILGVGYLEDSDQYVIQTNVEGNYSFKILNAEFQITEDLGEYAKPSEGSNFQDLCVNGDYIINFPLTLNLGIGDFIHMYSISRRAMVASNPINWNFTGVVADEPESICEVSPGVFAAVVNVVMEDGSRAFRLYKTAIPYNFTVTTSVSNGTITDSSSSVLRGDSYQIAFEPLKDYTIDSVMVDGKKMDSETYESDYTFSDVQSDHTIKVKYKEMTWMQKTGAFFGKLKPQIHISKGFVTGCLVVLVIVGLFALYLRILYVRRMRIIKRRRAARARRRAIREYECMDPDELEDREMREYIELK